MRFATRILVGSFVPFTVLLAVAFYIVNTAAVNSVREAVRAGVRDNQLAVRALWARSDNREQRILQGVADSPVLKAGLELIASNGLAEEQARNTVRDQLSEISEALRFDLMVVSSVRGDPLVGVVRQAHGFAALDAVRLHPPRTGLFAAGGQVYQLRSVPIFQGPAQVATLSVGELFDISRFGIPAVLLHQGEAISANSTDRSIRELGPSLRPCLAKAECQVQIGKQLYVSLRLASGGTEADGYEVRSLQNVDAASAGLQTLLKRLFLLAGLAALAAALGISFLASRSIARPLAQMALRLRQANALSDLPDFPATETGPQEIRDLAQGFNQAAEAVREGRERLTRAYVEFVGSLAQALDARDSYTAGHSRRVSEYSSAIAKAMGF
ncbi:MAG: hypothetical protein JOZ22_20385, partial [Acidobacteriia bacterium]|nr:hypothetical protein [Terriglobia bacterium]